MANALVITIETPAGGTILWEPSDGLRRAITRDPAYQKIFEEICRIHFSQLVHILNGFLIAPRAILESHGPAFMNLLEEFDKDLIQVLNIIPRTKVAD